MIYVCKSLKLIHSSLIVIEVILTIKIALVLLVKIKLQVGKMFI